MRLRPWMREGKFLFKQGVKGLDYKYVFIFSLSSSLPRISSQKQLNLHLGVRSSLSDVSIVIWNNVPNITYVSERKLLYIRQRSSSILQQRYSNSREMLRRICESNVSLLVISNSPFAEMKNSIHSSVRRSPVVVFCRSFTRAWHCRESRPRNWQRLLDHFDFTLLAFSYFLYCLLISYRLSCSTSWSSHSVHRRV